MLFGCEIVQQDTEDIANLELEDDNGHNTVEVEIREAIANFELQLEQTIFSQILSALIFKSKLLVFESWSWLHNTNNPIPNPLRKASMLRHYSGSGPFLVARWA